MLQIVQVKRFSFPSQARHTASLRKFRSLFQCSIFAGSKEARLKWAKHSLHCTYVWSSVFFVSSSDSSLPLSGFSAVKFFNLPLLRQAVQNRSIPSAIRVPNKLLLLVRGKACKGFRISLSTASEHPRQKRGIFLGHTTGLLFFCLFSSTHFAQHSVEVSCSRQNFKKRLGPGRSFCWKRHGLKGCTTQTESAVSTRFKHM